VLWDSIKDNPPKELKISPNAAIPHKSKDFRSILDLSFRLRLKNGGVRTSVNDTTEKTAPSGAIDQIGECLLRIIHAFAETDDEAKIFMAKWDIKVLDSGWSGVCWDQKPFSIPGKGDVFGFLDNHSNVAMLSAPILSCDAASGIG
jgi:hypothetical protein